MTRLRSVCANCSSARASSRRPRTWRRRDGAPTSHSTISLVVLGVAVVLFVLSSVSPEIVALGAAVALDATG
jgi:hypothetical protein